MMAILMIIGFLIILVFIIKKNVNVGFISLKHQKIFFALYFFILLFSTGALYLVPQKNFIQGNTNNQPTSFADMNTLISKGNFEDSKIFLKKENWSFSYKGKLLKITSNNIRVIAEKKEIDDGKIDVIYYVPFSSFNQINVTDMVSPAIVELNKNELVLKEDEKYKVSVKQFNYDFTVNQFTDNSNNHSNEVMSQFFLQKIMYIKIPKSLELDESQNNVEMITKQ